MAHVKKHHITIYFSSLTCKTSPLKWKAVASVWRIWHRGKNKFRSINDRDRGRQGQGGFGESRWPAFGFDGGWNFGSKSFSQLNNLSTYHFVRLTFCQLVNLPTYHYVIIMSSYFISLLFCQLAILLHIHIILST